MRWPRWLLLCALATFACAAAAQSLEGVLMPGKVIAGHAKYEQDCGNCHVRFDRAAQDRLCRDCHKPVAADIDARRGLHGRQEQKACRACHTDHKGRDVDIAPLDEKAFDHARTDFGLRGAHARLACKSCHSPGRKHRETPGDCNDCHRADDRHRGALGTRCADCHGETTWKDARFDHAKTRFLLEGAHSRPACSQCHRDLSFKGASLACISCHRSDDRQHRGRLGDRCDSCHTVRDWKPSTFDHDRDTRYALKGRHRQAKCETCHTAPPSRDKLPTACASCHRDDDKHRGTLGSACGDCHVERGWREARVDHAATRFPLRGKHADVDCRDCHRDAASYKGTPLECNACHRKDDRHKTRFGSKCESCHVERSWREITFRHDRDTRYALKGRHATVSCDSCHAGRVYEDRLSTECNACHSRDDPHKGTLGAGCASCHDESSWKVARFDHSRTRFVLVASHARAKCDSCHKTQRYRDLPRDCFGCHERDDRHKATLGHDCASCHNARDWRLWDFDHARRTSFALDGAHRTLACAGCHRSAALPGGKLPSVPTACVGCHLADDRHGGEFGPACERCHDTRDWRDVRLPSGGQRTPRDDGRRKGTLQ